MLIRLSNFEDDCPHRTSNPGCPLTYVKPNAARLKKYTIFSLTRCSSHCDFILIDKLTMCKFIDLSEKLLKGIEPSTLGNIIIMKYSYFL